ncbi:transcriptional regulator, TetR family [Lentzea fradiae]|uniref:Transcriptional regulator, TetR family n=1 Tax=Lentzea fradiae TaxID=200378 RepID=A0A1G7NGG2_9PSEU|nr:AsnC family protein [Lentzea fradiae]SDF73185.1 transcriptional regulator, TetR family [Lentzea fradiae]
MGTGTRRLRADAEQNTARILEAAAKVLAADPSASLERIGEAAGLTRATVHRRFASRQALLEALAAQLNQRYVDGLERSCVDNPSPREVLLRFTEAVFELKTTHLFAMELVGTDCATGLSPEVVAGIERIFARLRAAGEITETGDRWCRRVYLALLHEVHLLPGDAAELRKRSRAELVVGSVLGALGGMPGQG